MFVQLMMDFQHQFFFGLNRFAEPLIRAGIGSPPPWPMPWSVGTIVVETTGRKTERKINIPVLAMRIGEMMVISTVRSNLKYGSQWIKNLAANPDVRYWLAGQPRKATAFVFTPGKRCSTNFSLSLPPNANACEASDKLKFVEHSLPPNAACLAQFLQLQSRLLGISFALLTPR